MVVNHSDRETTMATKTKTLKRYSDRETTTYHEGRPIIRECGRGAARIIGVLCPYGHVYTSIPAREWAGSWLEAKAGDPEWTVRCDGTIAR